MSLEMLKENKEHFKYIRSYSPYENIKKMDYPHLFITTKFDMIIKSYSMNLQNICSKA